MNRKYIVFALILVSLLVSIGTFWVNRTVTPIRIGFVAGLSGKFADLGVDCRRGVEMAIARFNQAHGVKGRPIEMIAMDDGQNEKMALAAVKSLLEKNVPVIIGHATSSMTMTTLPLISGSQTLLVGPTSSTSRLQDLDDNFIRSCAVSTAAAAMLARYLITVKGARSVGVIYDLGNEAYTGSWFDTFKKTFLEEGGIRVEPLTFTSKPDLQLLPLVQHMKERNVDALAIVANSVDAAMLCQQVRKSDWQVQLALADWAATEQLINLGGSAVEGVTIQQFFNRKSTKPAYVEFKREFEQKYKTEPGFGALHAYNAAMMVFRSMNEQHENETLKQAILRISHFKGLQDDIVINKFGDSNHPTYMGVVQNGEFVILEDYQ